MEKHNPNSDHADTPKSWSDLPADLLISVFERLSFANFQRAKSVCSSWNSASRQCVPKNNEIPWLILFPEKDKDNNNGNTSCTLFNPEEKDKLYRTQDLGLEFAKSECMASYGSWLLMQNPLDNLYIVNLFTHERISLPPVESQLGTTKVERCKDDVQFRITCPNGEVYKVGNISIRSPVFWIDKKTKDYVVLWGHSNRPSYSNCVFYSKKGDNSWKQIPEAPGCFHMVYKDHKLYFFSHWLRDFQIFDFSGEIPQQTFRCGVDVERFMYLRRQLDDSWFLVMSSLVVTVAGDVLKVDRLRRRRSTALSFRVFKVYSSSGMFLKRHVPLDSLGDEAILLDQGITVLAGHTNGFIRNSIYLSDIHGRKNTSVLLLFSLETRKTKRLHKFDCSSLRFSSTRWFIPSFTHIHDADLNNDFLFNNMCFSRQFFILGRS